MPHDIAIVNEALDNGRTRRRRAEALLAHGFAQFLVFNQFARAFHRGKKCRLAKTRRRFGFVVGYLDIEHFCRFVRHNRHERLIVTCSLHSRFASVNGEPASILNDLAVCLECILINPRDPRRHFKLRCREKDADEAAFDHVVNFLLPFIEAVRRCARRNNGKVVGDFRVVKNALGWFDPLVPKGGAGVVIVDLA